MMRAAICFVYETNFHARLRASLLKYKPDWVEIVDRDADIVIGHYGISTIQPFWRFISPKLVFLEERDGVFVETLTDRDVVITYNPEMVEWIKGINPDARVELMRFPVDTEIFRLKNRGERPIDLIITGTYHDGGLSKVFYEAAGRPKAVVLGDRIDISGPVTFDYCHPNTEDDERLVNYYNSAKYIISFHTEAGFETSYAEALLCGCRPIIPNRPFYRWIYGDLAEYIDLERIKDEAAEFFKRYNPVTEEEVEKAVKLFNAREIWSKIWEIAREVLA